MTDPTEAEDAAAHVAHYGHHVTRCDRIKELLAEATRALNEAKRLIGCTAEDDWGGDGELGGVACSDATGHHSAALAHIRDMGRIVDLFRVEAEKYRQLNAEFAECSKCGFSGDLAERFDAETDRRVWLCQPCRHNAALNSLLAVAAVERSSTPRPSS